MAALMQRIQNDPTLAEAGLRDRIAFTQAPDGRLVVRAPVKPGAIGAVALLRAILDSRESSVAGDAEVTPLPDEQLAAWTRPPGAVPSSAWEHVPHTDARWCWALSLLALMAEQWIRGRQDRLVEESVQADAA